MEPEGSSPHTKAPATCPYPEPAQSSPHTLIPPPEGPSHCNRNQFCTWKTKILLYVFWYKDRGILVGIATCYGLDGSGFEPRWGKKFCVLHTHSDRPWGPPPLMQWVSSFIPRVKLPGLGVNQSLSSRTEFKRGMSYTPNPPHPPCHRGHITVWHLPFDLCVVWYFNFLITSSMQYRNMS